MIYRHRFTVRAPVELVRDFHTRPDALASITPPPIRLKLHEAPASLESGGRMRFTLGVGPFGVGWTARVEDVSPMGFVDVQESGPFRQWTHRHAFVASAQGQTEVLDVIEIQLRPHLGWGAFGLGMVLGLPVLFAYRARRTRRLLEAA